MTLRLARTDLDLLALAGRGDFPSVCRRAARAFVLGDKTEAPARAAPKEGPTSIRLSFGEKDAETARFLSGVKKGFRSAALKLMIRSALGRPDLGPYTEDGGAAFRDGRGTRADRRRKGEKAPAGPVTKDAPPAEKKEERPKGEAGSPLDLL
jgi:hypothetical protein